MGEPKFVYEIKQYGVGAFLSHALYKLTPNLKARQRMYAQRDRAYRRFSTEQLKMELQRMYRNRMGIELNLDSPTRFTEKVQWLKLYDCTAEKTRLADKYLVREWVKKEIGGEHLPSLLGVWDSFDQIDFDRLPDRFCLKMNHGSSMNCVVQDKAKLDLEDAKAKFETWCGYPFYAETLELQYRDIPRKIIAEEYLEQEGGGLYDYKIHCFNGRPAFIQCIGDRDLEKHAGFQDNFDLRWNKLDWIFEDYPNFPYAVPKPERLDEMLEYAAQLSRDFCYVRVDLYEARGRIYFGEMTFTPASGIYPYRRSWTRDRDEELGRLLKLPADR